MLEREVQGEKMRKGERAREREREGRERPRESETGICTNLRN